MEDDYEVRDCEHCKHYMSRRYQDGVIWGCSAWECYFERKEDNNAER